ncbi:MAG: hypothetical protein WC979_02375 [Candidatus Pacearchaeota archaeon]|jgi:hypothetical protein|nr:hypothetical protein [Clostridia bacterium]
MEEITEGVNENGEKVLRIKIPIGLPKRHWWEFKKKKQDKLDEIEKVEKSKEFLSRMISNYKEDVKID